MSRQFMLSDGRSGTKVLLSIKSVTIKPWIRVPKAEAFEVSDKILSQVTKNPSWGAKKIADALVLEGVSLSSQSIYKFLVKRHLNRIPLRNAWKHNQEEIKS